MKFVVIAGQRETLVKKWVDEESKIRSLVEVHFGVGPYSLAAIYRTDQADALKILQETGKLSVESSMHNSLKDANARAQSLVK